MQLEAFRADVGVNPSASSYGLALLGVEQPRQRLPTRLFGYVPGTHERPLGGAGTRTSSVDGRNHGRGGRERTFQSGSGRARTLFQKSPYRSRTIFRLAARIAAVQAAVSTMAPATLATRYHCGFVTALAQRHV